MLSKTLAAAAIIASANAALTFPSPADEIESLLFLQSGYRAKGFADIVTPCSAEAYEGFNNAAGIIRTGFHDMAAHDASAGTDGLDASIGFELAGGAGEGGFADKNAGPSFWADMVYFSKFFNSKASMADLLALGVVSAVKSCGGPDIELSAGRIDATGSNGSPQLPDPKESADVLKGRFGKMGFSPQEMIQLVACGHTIGAVHKFVSGALVPTDPNSIAAANGKDQFPFDHTSTSFDNGIATDFCSPEKNGLPFGDSIDQLVRDTAQNSDTKIFQLDKEEGKDYGNTIESMAESNESFLAQCQFVMKKMINTVPSSVKLTEAIQPYDVKPVTVDLNLQPDGSISVLAEIRVRDGAVNGQVQDIRLVYVGHANDPCSGDCTIKGSPNSGNSAQGRGETFTFYQFSGAVSSISSYAVSINGQLFDNNGNNFPVDDSAFIQTASSNGNKIYIAVRGSGSPSVTITERSEIQFNSLPKLNTKSLNINKECTGSKFSFYSASYSVGDANSAKMDLSLGGKVVDAFRNVLFDGQSSIPDCKAITSTTTTTSSSSTTSDQSSSSTSTTSSDATTSSSSTSDASSSTSTDTTSTSSGTETSSTSSEKTTKSTSEGETTASTSSTSSGKSTVDAVSTSTTTKGSSSTTSKAASSTLTTTTKNSSGSASSTPSGSQSGKPTSTTKTASGSQSGVSSSTKTTYSGKAWVEWESNTATTSYSAVVTGKIVVPTKNGAKDAFASAIASVVDKLKKNPAKGVDDTPQPTTGLDLNIPVDYKKPTQTTVTQIYTYVYVSWSSAPTGKPGSGSNGNGNGNSYGNSGNGSGSQQSGSAWASSWAPVASITGAAPASPAATWQTWVSPSATSTSPVKAFTGAASSISAGGFLITAAGIWAAALLL